MTNRSIGTARLGGFKSLTSAAFLALGLMGAAGCAAATDPASSSSSPAPAPSSGPPTAEAPKANPAGTGETVSAKVDNSTGGTIALPNGTKVEVPAGALPPGVDTITVTSAPAAAATEYAAASPVYVFGPDGTVFLKPIKITMPLSLPAGKTVADLTILWSRARADGFDMVPTELAPVPGSSTDFIAIGEVTHFSEGFCGVKYTADPHPAKDPYAQ